MNNVPEHVKYERRSDTQAMVSTDLSDINRQAMANDDGTDDTRYELEITVYKIENVEQP